jgi:hypothetical protein
MPNADDIAWFKGQFQRELEAALAGTPFDVDMLVAIACQETGHIWSRLRKKSFTRAQILALCVGDTIDFRGPGRGRQAFPKTKAALIAKPNGQEMFDIARKALVDMAPHVPGFEGAVANPNKFCHGFGLFQRDLQFFLPDPNYFLGRKYENFEDTLAQCLDELRRGVTKLGFEKRTSLTDFEFACVAIVYNTGGFKPSKGLKQGHFNGSRFYGEEVFDFIRLSRGVSTPSGVARSAGRFVVVARGGLRLRAGPGTDFGILTTIESGTIVSVLGFDGRDGEWARVDLQRDGLIDGHLFAAFLTPADPDAAHEEADEPGEGES